MSASSSNESNLFSFFRENETDIIKKQKGMHFLQKLIPQININIIVNIIIINNNNNNKL